MRRERIGSERERERNEEGCVKEIVSCGSDGLVGCFNIRGILDFLERQIIVFFVKKNYSLFPYKFYFHFDKM